MWGRGMLWLWHCLAFFFKLCKPCIYRVFKMTWILMVCILLSLIQRYQRGNQNPYIDQEQTTQWPKDKVQKDKQRSTKHTYKTKDRVTRTPRKIGCELRYSGGVSSSFSTSGTRRVNLYYKPGDNSWMKKGPRSVYDKWNISVVICDTDSPQQSAMSWWRP